MADDLGVVYTDKRLSDLEKSLRRIYAQAGKDIDKKIEEFAKKAEKDAEKQKAKLNAGKITQDEYDQWMRNSVFSGQKWKAQRSDIAAVLANANDVANKMIRGEQYGVFGFNANYAAYDIEHGFGVNFDFSLYSKETVERLLKDNPNILPFKKLDKQKDARWNFQNIRSQVAQGILAGDSIPKIAKRLSNVVPDRNEKQMVLHARTAMTAAQNGGRQERYKEAEALGIKFKKVWIASLDGRTRDLHVDLDGEAVAPDEDFEIDGYAVAYPGDPWGAPVMVYNCRCTMGTELDDYPSHFDRRGKGENGYENVGDMTYREWSRERTKNQIIDSKIYEKFKDADLFSAIDMLGDKGRALEKLLLDKETGEYKEDYWNKFVNGEIKDQNIKNVLMSADDDLRKLKMSDEGVDLLRTFVEGGNSQIHRIAGYGFDGVYRPKDADLKKLKELDTVFSPASSDMITYKGESMFPSQIEQLKKDGGFLNHTLSSTSTSYTTAKAYAMGAYDRNMGDLPEDFVPVIDTIRFEDGIPTVDIRSTLGSEGMKAFESEVTVGRDVFWEYSNWQKDEDRWGNEYWTVDVTLRKKNG